jgi:hypothetical protein
MPFKTDDLTLDNEFLDRRVKLIACQKERIWNMHHREGWTMRGLARMFKVNRTLIKYICYPEALEKAKDQYRQRRKDGRYYKRTKHTEAIKDHRKHKRKTLNQNPNLTTMRADAKMKKLVKDLDFETEVDYFDYMISSLVNGNRDQARQLFKDLPRDYKHNALEWMKDCGYSKERDFYISLF